MLLGMKGTIRIKGRMWMAPPGRNPGRGMGMPFAAAVPTPGGTFIIPIFSKPATMPIANDAEATVRVYAKEECKFEAQDVRRIDRAENLPAEVRMSPEFKSIARLFADKKSKVFVASDTDEYLMVAIIRGEPVGLGKYRNCQIYL